MCICNDWLNVHVCLRVDMWKCVCLTVELTIFLKIISSSSLHLFIFFDCCVSLDPLPFTMLHLEVMQISSAFF